MILVTKQSVKSSLRMNTTTRQSIIFGELRRIEFGSGPAVVAAARSRIWAMFDIQVRVRTATITFRLVKPGNIFRYKLI